MQNPPPEHRATSLRNAKRVAREAWRPNRCEVAPGNGARSPFPAAFATARDHDLFPSRLANTLQLPSDWLRQLQLVSWAVEIHGKLWRPGW